MTVHRSHLLTFVLSALCAGAGVAAAKAPSSADRELGQEGAGASSLEGQRTDRLGIFAAASLDMESRSSSEAFGAEVSTGLEALGAAAELPNWPEVIAVQIDHIAERDLRKRQDRSASHRGSTQAEKAKVGWIRGDELLSRRLEAVSSRFPRNARVGIHVRDLDTGAVIFERHDGLGLNPASNQKLVTAAASLALLGGDYRFRTSVYLVDDALVLVGQGDPSLQIDDVYELAGRAAAALRGRPVDRVIYDDTVFGEERYGPGYREDGDDAYQAPSGALSLNFNTIEISVRAGAHDGDLVHVTTRPESAGVDVEVNARTRHGASSSPPQIHTEHRDGRTVVIVDGVVRPRTSSVTRRKITDPGSFTANAFCSVLGRVQGQTPLTASRGRLPAGAELLASHESETLATVLASAMKYSNNFTTEQLLRTLAWRASGEPGSFAAGTGVLERFLAALGHKEDVHVVNGSGLSTEGRLTPTALVDLLAMARSNDVHAADLLSSLATVGGEGTMHSRVHVGRGLVRAKTGTIGTVSALSGVVASPDGTRMLGFSILVNGYDAVATRPAQDAMVTALVGHTKSRRDR